MFTKCGRTDVRATDDQTHKNISACKNNTPPLTVYKKASKTTGYGMQPYGQSCGSTLSASFVSLNAYTIRLQNDERQHVERFKQQLEVGKNAYSFCATFFGSKGL